MAIPDDRIRPSLCLTCICLMLTGCARTIDVLPIMTGAAIVPEIGATRAGDETNPDRIRAPVLQVEFTRATWDPSASRLKLEGCLHTPDRSPACDQSLAAMAMVGPLRTYYSYAETGRDTTGAAPVRAQADDEPQLRTSRVIKARDYITIEAGACFAIEFPVEDRDDHLAFFAVLPDRDGETQNITNDGYAVGRLIDLAAGTR
jgi:hypothetical protein